MDAVEAEFIGAGGMMGGEGAGDALTLATEDFRFPAVTDGGGGGGGGGGAESAGPSPPAGVVSMGSGTGVGAFDLLKENGVGGHPIGNRL